MLLLLGGSPPSQHIRQPASQLSAPVAVQLPPLALLPRDRRSLPSGERYVMSINPLRSSPSSLKGTGYGTLKGSFLNVKAALRQQQQQGWHAGDVAGMFQGRGCCQAQQKTAQHMQSTAQHTRNQRTARQPNPILTGRIGSRPAGWGARGAGWTTCP